MSLLLIINTTCPIAALRYIPSALVPIIYATTPLLTILILKYRDRTYHITHIQYFGVIIGCIGVLIATYDSLHNVSLHTDGLIGVLFIVIGAFCFSLYGIMSKNFQSHYSPIHITYTMTLTAMCITAPFAFVDIVTHSYLSQIHIRHVVALITSGAVGTVAFYMCYQYAIKYIGPHAASLMTYIQPIFAIFLSIILVGDVITPLFVLGGICAVGGAYIIVK